MSLTFLPETIQWFAYPKLGKVEQAITPYQRGRVQFMSTSWFARLCRSNAYAQTELLPGTIVRILGRQGLTLIIMPLDEEDIQPQILIGNFADSYQIRKLYFLQLAGSIFCNLLSAVPICQQSAQVFSLGLFGVGIAYLLSAVLGTFPIVWILMRAFWNSVWFR